MEAPSLSKPAGEEHLSPQRRIPVRIVLVTLASVAGLSGVAVAFGIITLPIARFGKERRMVVRIDAPYGSVELRPGTDPNSVAAIRLDAQDAGPRGPHYSYTMAGRDIGVLHIGIGTDEGMLGQPPVVWRGAARPNQFMAVRSGAPEPDLGMPEQRPHAFGPMPPMLPNEQFNAGTQIYITRDLPIDFNAYLGFGESLLDLTRLQLTNAYIETGTSRATIVANEPNPETMSNCTVKAGLGGCTFAGIANLNVRHFNFKGAVGTFHLGYEGRLTQDMDAFVDMGIGYCTIVIPPIAGRVRVFYDEGMFNSYLFDGLIVHHNGYATSPGFNLSKAPVLTLHLTMGAGKIAVIYH